MYVWLNPNASGCGRLYLGPRTYCHTFYFGKHVLLHPPELFQLQPLPGPAADMSPISLCCRCSACLAPTEFRLWPCFQGSPEGSTLVATNCFTNKKELQCYPEGIRIDYILYKVCPRRETQLRKCSLGIELNSFSWFPLGVWACPLWQLLVREELSQGTRFKVTFKRLCKNMPRFCVKWAGIITTLSVFLNSAHGQAAAPAPCSLRK